MELVFILVEPATPENIGAAARAITTMGISNMRLVNPCDHLSEPAKWLAHASNDVLENAQLFDKFEDAIADCDFIIGTTAKQRSVKEDYLSIKETPSVLKAKGNTISKVAVAFGREDSGLRNEELRLCDLVSTVPLKTSYPSLNLAQAIMLYAYELSSIRFSTGRQENKKIDPESFYNLKKKTKSILLELGFKEKSAILPRIIERLNQLKEADIHLLHSITNKYLKKKS